MDENLPRSLTKALREAGHEVWDLRELGLRGITDEEVFRHAQSLKAVLITADKGFSDPFKLPSAEHYGIVVVRLPHELSTKILCREVLKALEAVEQEKLMGRLCVIKPGYVRFRPPLPERGKQWEKR